MSKISEIWYTRCPLPSASGIAQRQRWLHDSFAAAGVVAATIRTSTDRDVRDSHFTHLQPALFREGGPVPPMWSRALGRDTALVGVTRTDESQAVLVRAELRAKTTADLKGLCFGVPRHDTRHVDHARAHTLFGLFAVLRRAGLNASHVRLTDVDEGEYEIREPPVAVGQTDFPILNALLEGKVDAIYVTGARIGKFIAEHGLVALPEPDGSDISLRPGTPRPVTVNRTLAVEHPEIVARYLAVMLQAARWAEANPAGAAEVLGLELGLTEAELLSGFGPDLHRQLAVSLEPGLLAALAEQKDFLLKEGFLAGDFDFQSWIVSTPLALAESLIQQGDLPIAV